MSPAQDDAPVFFVGDRVELRSGGVEMVVRPFSLLGGRVRNKVQAGLSIGCGWFSGKTARFREEAFAVDNLRLVGRGSGRYPALMKPSDILSGGDFLPPTDNPFQHWVQENITIDKTSVKRYSPAQIYSDYEDWCKWSGIPAVSFGRFCKAWPHFAKDEGLLFKRSGVKRSWQGFTFHPDCLGARL